MSEPKTDDHNKEKEANLYQLLKILHIGHTKGCRDVETYHVLKVRKSRTFVRNPSMTTREIVPVENQAWALATLAPCLSYTCSYTEELWYSRSSLHTLTLNVFAISLRPVKLWLSDVSRVSSQGGVIPTPWFLSIPLPIFPTEQQVSRPGVT